MPVIDDISRDYADQVDFVAPAWKGSFEATKNQAEALLTSGNVMWGLDGDEVIFGLYGVPYQPVTVLIAHDDTVVEAWPGIRGEDEIRAALDALIALAG